MAKVNFYLDKPNAAKETPVFMFFSFDGQRVKLATGETILPKEWNKNKQCARSSYTGHVEFNLRLDKYKAEIEKIYREAIINGNKPSELKLKAIFDEREGRKKGKSLFEVIEEYIGNATISRARASVLKYKTIYRHLRDYCRSKKQTFDFNDIDLSFLDGYKNYLLSVNGHTNNTVFKNIAIVKTFLNYAAERGYNKNYEFKKFKLSEKEGDVIFLTFDELMKVYKLPIEEKRLERVRDIFCLCCFTGLRFSDVIRLRPEYIVENSLILRSQKTQESLSIPLNNFAKDILNRYMDTSSNCFMKISNQRMNDYLKEVGQLAKIDSKMTVTRYRGAEKIESTKPKYEFLTTHIGRKTFITNSIYFGMKTEVLMDITGHKTHKAFKRYYKIIDVVKKSEMDRTWNKYQQL